MTFGLGFCVGSGLISSSSVSSATAGIPVSKANAQLTLIHVVFFIEIIMIFASMLVYGLDGHA
jgi:hypothetical protein